MPQVPTVAELETSVSLNEIFYSIQGEGLFAGDKTVFIRFQGCGLRCVWCDTKDSWPFQLPSGKMQTLGSGIGAQTVGFQDFVAKPLTVKEIVSEVKRFENATNICITGGEPLQQPKAFRALVRALSAHGYDIHVETSGAFTLPDRRNPNIPHWVMDIKLPDSGMWDRNKFENLQMLTGNDAIKFVTASREDFEAAVGVLENFQDITAWAGPRDQEERPWIYFNPVWETCQPSDLAEWILGIDAKYDKVRMGQQLHKIIWGDIRGV